MKLVFADTWFFLALFSSKDQGHQRAVRFLKKNRRPMLTTARVITELADALASPVDKPLFLRARGFLFGNTRLEIVEAGRTVFENGLALYSSRLDKGWSLTDCISFDVMKQRGVRDALTADRHFEQAGFRAMLLPAKP